MFLAGTAFNRQVFSLEVGPERCVPYLDQSPEKKREGQKLDVSAPAILPTQQYGDALQGIGFCIMITVQIPEAPPATGITAAPMAISATRGFTHRIHIRPCLTVKV